MSAELSAELAACREQLVALLPRLRRVARGFARAAADADDLVQLSLERALRRWRQWQPGTRLGSWLFCIMRNAWVDELRTRPRRGEVLLAEEAGVQITDAGARDPLEALAIEAALHQLPEEQRLAGLLVLVEGLSYKEAAEALWGPVGTLSSRP